MIDFFNRIGRFLPVVTGSYTQLTANHGYEVRWLTPMQSMVRSSANGWPISHDIPGGIPSGIPSGIPAKNKNLN
jgi:hypothetical protein